jgi:hypothetical protein
MAANPLSILDTVKKVIGFEPDDTSFDIDLIMYINSAFGELQQLGAGGDTGFIILDNSTLWAQYSVDLTYIEMIKSFICMTVRLAFDPPATSFGITALKDQIDKLGFRINIAAETASPPSDPFAVEAIMQQLEEGVTIFEGGVMPTYFAPRVVVLKYETVVTPDAKDGNVFYLTLDGDCTINAPVNAVDGEHLTMGLTSAGHAVTWGTGWNFGDAGLPSVTPGKTDIISGVFRAATNQWNAGYTPGF